MLKLLKRGDLKSMPWKNGGGVTREVAIHPPAAHLSRLDFNWRVSMARVDVDGPFSAFPGYERALVVWKGEGLLIEEKDHRTLQPFTFSGDAPVSAQLIAGGVDDFGVIFKRGACACTLSADSLREDSFLSVTAQDHTFVLCARGELRADGFYLNPGDVVYASAGLSFSLKALEDSRFVIAHIQATP